MNITIGITSITITQPNFLGVTEANVLPGIAYYLFCSMNNSDIVWTETFLDEYFKLITFFHSFRSC